MKEVFKKFDPYTLTSLFNITQHTFSVCIALAILNEVLSV